MSIAIDASGRLVIPKAVRDAAGIQPGTPLDVRFRDGRIEIEPAPLNVSVRVVGGVAVAVPDEAVPTLRAEQMAVVQDRLRAERG
jgi:AbrB family looped-hinge helix DNA binding protein